MLSKYGLFYRIIFNVYFQCERLKGGLAKIGEANVQLDDLNAKLAVQKVVVAQATQECELLLNEISTGRLRAFMNLKKHGTARCYNILVYHMV